MKLLLPAFFIAVFILINWQNRRELKKELPLKDKKPLKNQQMDLFNHADLLHPLTEN